MSDEDPLQFASTALRFNFGPTYSRDMDPTACVEHGGHCWQRDAMVLASNPLTYTEYCKHCPAYRRGHQQPDMAWSEPMLPDAPS